MLKDIHIQNYRGIKDLHIKDFKRINLLVGDNNSGKTSVLEAITILYPNLFTFSQIVTMRETGFIFLKTNQNNSFLLPSFPSLANQFYKRDSEKPFKIEALLTGNGGKKFEKKLSLEASLSKNHKDFKQVIDTQAQPISEINSFIAKYSLGTKTQELGFSTNGTGKIIGENFNTKHVFISDMSPKTQEIVKRFAPVAHASREQEYVEIMKNFEPELRNIKQVENDLFFEKNDGTTISISYMGSGFVRFLSIFLTIESLKNETAVLCIDEICSGLHYSKQEFFWQMIFALLKKFKNLQIFATTQSDELIASLSNVFEKIGKKDLGKDEIRLFKIRKNLKEEILVGDYNADEIEAKIELGVEVR